ncbi:MAG: MarR family winged helix-turn-helix transcriptional regulator [Anaerolineaceae bacterium]|jgi:DNA-binding MarR family transcriptional regulator
MVLYESLKAIFLHIDNHEKAFLGKHNLTVPRFYVLIHINNHPGINYIDLSDLLLCTKSNTTRIVQGMLKDGLITRKADPDDGRSYRLGLSVKGQALLDQVLPEYERFVNKLMSPLKAHEINRYTKVSQHIESTLAPKTVKTSKGPVISIGG